MALQGQIPIEFGMVFPSGAYAAGGIEMVRDFDRSSGDRVIQQADKYTGLPLWVVEVIDAQESARQRTVKVKIAAEYQPVLPPPAPGSPFTAVEFDGMTATPTSTPPAARATASASAPRGRPTPSRPRACGLPRGGSAARHPSTRTRRDGPARPGGALCLRVGSRHEVAFVPFPAKAPLFVIGAAGTLVSFTLPEQIEAGHVDFARQHAAKAWAHAVAVERRYRGLPPLPDVPVPYTLTAQAEALLDAGPVGPDLVPLPGGREVTA